MFSILIPTFNNLEYLKVCINSIKKNSKFNHQLIIHVNEGTDGTLKYIKEKKLSHTFSKENIGMPKALNKASKLSLMDYILISHDDFYYCPGWDIELIKNVNYIGHKNFYLSSTMVGAGQVKFDAGQTVEEFNEIKLLDIRADLELSTISSFASISSSCALLDLCVALDELFND